MVNVAIISKSDARGGGASRVAEDLAGGLQRRGIAATHFIAHKGERDFDEGLQSLYRRRQSQIDLGQRVFRKIGLPDVIPLEWSSAALARIVRDYDVIHFHDLTTVMSPWTVRWMAGRRPCVWTFHDCSPFTGGCFYPMDCDRFRTRCGDRGGCPQIGHFPTNGKIDLTGFIQRTKAALHATGRLTCVTPSQWMSHVAHSSGLFREAPTVLANGVDTRTFKPSGDRAALRRALGVPDDRPVVLIAAGDLRDPRKGLVHSVAALNAVADLDPFALIVGHAGPELEAALGGIDFKAVGYVDGRADLARWYSVADVFLFCSLADNQPIAILETMACGVPLVGFATGGIPEMVESGRSGMVVPQRDDAALQGALRAALVPGTNRAWGLAARALVESRFSDDAFIDRHLDLYASARAH